ncbi:MAG: hypothetical protein K6D96_09485 [Acetatifactor sp.]|nr:hypothetical protein [Acetatifactor sp.]
MTTETKEKKTEEKSKKTALFICLDVIVFLITVTSAFLTSFFAKRSEAEVLLNTVLCGAACGVFLFKLRSGLINAEFDYDNNIHPVRIYLVSGLMFVISVVCAYLPKYGWPIPALYLTMMLFSNAFTGLLGGSLFLLICCIASGVSVEVFALYFASGAFTVCIFEKLDKEFKVSLKVALSMVSYSVMLIVGAILSENSTVSPESFMIPVLNIVVTTILFIGILKLFSSSVIFKERNKFLEANDTENPLLVKLRENDHKSYMLSIHTVYFCERIAGKIGLDTESLKCAAYYHVLLLKNRDILSRTLFPDSVFRILFEYANQKLPVSKECTVICLCNYMVGSLQFLIEKNGDKKIDFDLILDSLFDKVIKDGYLKKSDLSFAEFMVIKDVFKGEKLYYDFLR